MNCYCIYALLTAFFSIENGELIFKETDRNQNEKGNQEIFHYNEPSNESEETSTAVALEDSSKTIDVNSNEETVDRIIVADDNNDDDDDDDDDDEVLEGDGEVPEGYEEYDVDLENVKADTEDPQQNYS